MSISRFLMLALLGMLLSWTARAADTRPDCHSCHIEIQSLDQPAKLAGKWLFTRDDRPENKDPVWTLRTGS